MGMNVLQGAIRDRALELVRDQGFADSLVEMRPNSLGHAVLGVVLPLGIQGDDPVVDAIAKGLDEIAKMKGLLDTDITVKINREGRVVIALVTQMPLIIETPAEREARRRSKRAR